MQSKNKFDSTSEKVVDIVCEDKLQSHSSEQAKISNLQFVTKFAQTEFNFQHIFDGKVSSKQTK